MAIISPLQVRGELLRLDKYSLVKNGRYETFPDTIKRVMAHQEWLWTRAVGRKLNNNETQELVLLENSILKRQQCCSGRTLMLGGTKMSQQIEATQFNCAFLKVKSVRDVVDFFWLLLNGCGVGAHMELGLTGFKDLLTLEVIRSQRTTKGGNDNNIEIWDNDSKIWRIIVGDSAAAWAKFVGKILAHPFPAKKLILDFREIRPAGIRLAKYGWISSGDAGLATASTAIVNILNNKVHKFLSKIDVLDILNWLGTTLNSRRSAEIAIMEASDPEASLFMCAKNDPKNYHRQQSNNSLIFYTQPSRQQLKEILNLTLTTGEPGLINGDYARKKAFWFEGLNPCGETLLMSKSFCNLWEINVADARMDEQLKQTVYLAARANYRQTLVNLHDGILQEDWHRQNEFLRLCGLGLTGIQAAKFTSRDLMDLNQLATNTMQDFAHSLGTIPSQAMCLAKPSGTLSKSIFRGVPEGIHYLPAKYVFNNINITAHNPLFEKLKRANFKISEHPYLEGSFLVRLPVDNSRYYRPRPGAIVQLEQYKQYLTHWCDHNISNTIFFRKDEIPAIIKWMEKNWDNYLSATFFPMDTQNCEQYKYLPQEEVEEATFKTYVGSLDNIDLSESVFQKMDIEITDCAGGMCPVN